MEQTKQAVQAAIDYIEENLTQDIDNAALAKVVGYSEYHFLRVFRKVVGITPADYIRKRRISEIVRCMDREERPISEIAFEFGFNSKENFTRAFKREHHILPTDYKSTQNSLKLYDRLTFELLPFDVRCEIVSLAPFRLVVYPSDEEYTPHFWNKYNTQNRSKILSGGAVTEDFGVCIWNREKRRLDYFIGIRESEAKGDLTGTLTLEIEGGTYAVFDTPPATQFHFVASIHRTWDYIARVWLPENGYRRTGGYELESYIEQSRRYSERIYIPIIKENEHEKA